MSRLSISTILSKIRLWQLTNNHVPLGSDAAKPVLCFSLFVSILNYKAMSFAHVTAKAALQGWHFCFFIPDSVCATS